jgi:uncharacterized protein
VTVRFSFLVACLLVAGCEAEPAGAEAYLLDPASELPALTGRVVDNARLLDAAVERRLSSLSERLEARTSDQLVVVTTPSLGGRAIEDYGVSLGRHWGIGQRGRNNGVLLIVVPDDRRARIEVGCGLERALPDEEAARIMRDDILPHMREGNLAAGIQTGSEAIVRTLMTRAAIARAGEC